MFYFVGAMNRLTYMPLNLKSDQCTYPELYPDFGNITFNYRTNPTEGYIHTYIHTYKSTFNIAPLHQDQSAYEPVKNGNKRKWQKYTIQAKTLIQFIIWIQVCFQTFFEHSKCVTASDFSWYVVPDVRSDICESPVMSRDECFSRSAFGQPGDVRS